MAKIAIVGAGLAGIICAQRLRQAGYDGVLVEKSRGWGGRLSTRRLEVGAVQPGFADHGVRLLNVQGPLTKILLSALSDRSIQPPIVQLWTTAQSVRASDPDILEYCLQTFDPQCDRLDPGFDPQQFSYASPSGISAVAKYLSKGVPILLRQRVQQITPTDTGWSLHLEPPTSTPTLTPALTPAAAEFLSETGALAAQHLVLAIPAPQALELLQPIAPQLPADLIASLQSVTYDPCITAIAVYASAPAWSAIPWRGVQFDRHSDLAWVGLESSKTASLETSETNAAQSAFPPILTVQSTAAFAQTYLEAPDLMPIGQLLLTQAAACLLPEIATPEQLQVHRWRYAFVRQAVPDHCVSSASSAAPIVCGGDWCGGDRLEAALRSGLAMANQIMAPATVADPQPSELSALLAYIAALP